VLLAVEENHRALQQVVATRECCFRESLVTFCRVSRCCGAVERHALGMAAAVQQARIHEEGCGHGEADCSIGEELAWMEATLQLHEDEMQLKAAVLEGLFPALDTKAHTESAMQLLLAKYLASWDTLPYVSEADFSTVSSMQH
jgi:hypothetical protein